MRYKYIREGDGTNQSLVSEEFVLVLRDVCESTFLTVSHGESGCDQQK